MANLKFHRPAFRFGTPVRKGEGINLKLSVIDSDVNLVLKNLKQIQNIIKVRLAKTVSGVVVDLLSKSLPMTPVDTGELRESATGKLLLGSKTLTIAKGNASGSVTDMTQKINSSILKNARKVEFDVTFTRTNETGDNIAVWAHEDLNAYEARVAGVHPAARTPGTGPKYLERPWLENKQMYEQLIRQSVSTNKIARIIQSSTRRRRLGKGKYEVEQVEILGW